MTGMIDCKGIAQIQGLSVRSRFYVLIAALFTSFGVNAGLISASHPVFGDGSLTLDTDQSLYWLSPVQTVGMTYNSVMDLLANDTRYNGFRFASLAELEILYVAAGIPDINVPGDRAYYGTPRNVGPVSELQRLTGVTYFSMISGTSLFETAGYVGSTFINPTNGRNSVYLGDLIVRSGVPPVDGITAYASAFTKDSALSPNQEYVGVGSWLVTPVPVPPAWQLLTGALALFMGVRRVRAKHAKRQVS